MYAGTDTPGAAVNFRLPAAYVDGGNERANRYRRTGNVSEPAWADSRVEREEVVRGASFGSLKLCLQARSVHAIFQHGNADIDPAARVIVIA
jgi:hypothetical protein